MSNVEAAHSCRGRVRVYEDAVIVCGTLSPCGNSVNVLILHATNPGDVTWSVKCSNGGRENADLFMEFRKVQIVTRQFI